MRKSWVDCIDEIEEYARLFESSQHLAGWIWDTYNLVYPWPVRHWTPAQYERVITGLKALAANDALGYRKESRRL